VRTYAGVGARDAPAHVLHLVRQVAGELARAGWALRTGGARGCDAAWEAGARAAGGAVDVVLPSDPLPPRALEVAEAHHPAWRRCDEAARGLLARNVAVVLGRDLASPAAAVLYWRPEHLARGGTLHAVLVARSPEIPVENVVLSRALRDGLLTSDNRTR
jgi:hypothetical protein